MADRLTTKRALQTVAASQNDAFYLSTPYVLTIDRSTDEIVIKFNGGDEADANIAWIRDTVTKLKARADLAGFDVIEERQGPPVEHRVVLKLR